MAKKRKNTREKIKKKQQQIAKLAFDDLVTKGDKLTSDKKLRDAIKIYKLAVKNAKSNDQVQVGHCKLFAAYQQRAKELAGKNMQTEAASLQKQAMNYLPAPDTIDLPGIAFVIELCDIGKAFGYVEKYADRKGADPLAGVLLADRLVTQNAWNYLVKKEAPFFISRDAPVMKACIPLMDKGQWQQASDDMKALPRSSSFAHIRMFCRAMALFGQGDDKNMAKAISLIPEASVFGKIAAALGKTALPVKEKTGMREENALMACLWDGVLDAWQTAEKIIEKEEKNQFDNTMKQLVATFSKQILPEDPQYATQYLVETLWQRDRPDEKAFMAFEKALLSKKIALLDTKRKILYMNNPLDNAAQYLAHLKKIHSDPQRLAMVESAIFQYVCRVFSVSQSIQNELTAFSRKTATRFGLSPGARIDVLWMQCAARGIQCNPGNRELYELVAQKNARAREAKKIKEELLLSMHKAFPDDPYPCIELASVYHGKNAFRKAENILKKAMELAPYDSRVQDMHIISLVISADKSLNKGNYQRARKDLEKAKNLDSGTNALLLQEKELFYEICEQPKITEKVIGLTLNQFSLFQRLKLVSMLCMDIQNKPQKNHPAVSRKIRSLFKNELRQIPHLASEELLTLLTPFPREWQHVFASPKVHRVFLDTDAGVPAHLNSDDLIQFMDRVLSPDTFTSFRREVERRIREKKNDPNDDLLIFYAVVLDGIIDDIWDVEKLMDMVEDAAPEMKEKFKAAGERLSRHTHGPYRSALQRLDFEFLENLLFDDPFDGLFYDDDDDDDDFNPFGIFSGGMPDIGELNDPFVKNLLSNQAKSMKRENPRMFQEMFEELKAMLESIIDEEGLRGAPTPLLKKAKTVLMENDPKLNELILMINILFSNESKKGLSREAKSIFLQ